MSRTYGFSAHPEQAKPVRVKTLPPIPKPVEEARKPYTPHKPDKVKTLPPLPEKAQEERRPLSDIIHGAVRDAEHDISMGQGKGLADVAR